MAIIIIIANLYLSKLGVVSHISAHAWFFIAQLLNNVIFLFCGAIT